METNVMLLFFDRTIQSAISSCILHTLLPTCLLDIRCTGAKWVVCTMFAVWGCIRTVCVSSTGQVSGATLVKVILMATYTFNCDPRITAIIYYGIDSPMLFRLHLIQPIAKIKVT